MKLFLKAVCTTLAIAAFGSNASAQELFWSGGLSGEFNDPSNWSTTVPNTDFNGSTSPAGLVPGTANVAVFNVDVNNGTAVNDLTVGVTGVPLNITLSSLTPSNNTLKGLIVTDYFFWGKSTGGMNFNNTSGRALTITGSNSSAGDFIVDGYETLNYSGNGINVNRGNTVIGDDLFSNINTEAGSGTLILNTTTLNFTPSTGQTTTTYLGYSQTSTNNNFIFGSAVGTITEIASTVTLGNKTYLGYNGGRGTWNLTGNSVLQNSIGLTTNIFLGSNGGPNSLNGTGAVGTLNIADGSIFSVGNVGSNTVVNLVLGIVDPNYAQALAIDAGTGVINQNGSASIVNFTGQQTFVGLGESGKNGGSGGSGTYNLINGTLLIGTNSTDNVTFVLGDGLNSDGRLVQTGGNLVFGTTDVTNTSSFVLGNLGDGVYTISGGMATFNRAITYGGGQINLNGGILAITPDNLGNSSALNLGGGTLKLLPGIATTYLFGTSNLSGAASTIDASTSNLTDFTFANALSGNGGISLIGRTVGGTTFNFASQAPAGGFGTQQGSVSISNGTLNLDAADLQNAPALNLITGSSNIAPTINLTVGLHGNVPLPLVSTINGGGTLNVNFEQPSLTLSLIGANSATGVSIILAANTGPNASTTAGTLSLAKGNFGSITEVGAGNNLVIGGATTGTVTIANDGLTGTTSVSQNFTLFVPDLIGTGAGVGDITNAGALVTTDATLGIIGNIANNSGLINVLGTNGITGNVVANTGTIMAPTISGAVTTAGTLITLHTGALDNSGIVFLTPSSAVGTNFTVNGSLTSTGTLTVRLANGLADSYTATGAVVASGVVKIFGSGTVNDLPILTGSTAAIGGNGNPNDAGGLITNPGPMGVLFSGSVTLVGGNSIHLSTLQRTVIEASQAGLIPALTFNQTQVAQSIDPVLVAGALPFGATLNAYADIAPASIPGVMDSLTPASLQYSRLISFENVNFMAERMHNVDANLRAGYGGLDTSAVSVTMPGFNNGLGHSMNSFMASDVSPYYRKPAPNGVNYYPGGQGGPAGATPAEAVPTFEPSSQVISDSPNPYLAIANPAGPETPKTSEFIGGDVILADLNQDHGAANAPSTKANYIAGDVMAGASYRITPHFAAGVLFDYNHTDANTDGSGSKIKVDSYNPGIYATWFDHGFYVDGLGAFGYNSYSNQRAIPLLGTTATSSPEGQQYVADLNAGYDFHPDKSWVVGPTASITYAHLDVDSFSEGNAPGAELNVASQSTDSLRSRLGAHAIYQTLCGDVLLQPNLSIMWQHEFLNDADTMTSTFEDFTASSFATRTLSPSRDSALINLGLTATLNTSMAFYLNYMADIGADDYWAQSVVAGMKARF